MSAPPDEYVLICSGGNRVAWFLRRLADRIEGGRSVRVAIVGDFTPEQKRSALRAAYRQVCRDIAATLGEVRRIDSIDREFDAMTPPPAAGEG